jgi:hypothetical protein
LERGRNNKRGGGTVREGERKSGREGELKEKKIGRRKGRVGERENKINKWERKKNSEGEEEED